MHLLALYDYDIPETIICSEALGLATVRYHFKLLLFQYLS